MTQFSLTQASLNDFAVLKNLWHYYVYDLSRYCGGLKNWVSPTELSFQCDDLTQLFNQKNSHVFLVKIENENAGFVVVNKLENMPEIDWFMQEFYIISKYQQSGLGHAVAKEIFEKFHGKWSVGILPENTAALNFWRKVISAITKENFQEVLKTSDQLKTDEHQEPYPMIMIHLST